MYKQTIFTSILLIFGVIALIYGLHASNWTLRGNHYFLRMCESGENQHFHTFAKRVLELRKILKNQQKITTFFGQEIIAFYSSFSRKFSQF